MKALILALLPSLLTTPALGQWRTSFDTDPMTGKRSAYAHSPRTSATERIDWPYQDTRAWLGFGCDGSSEWAYIGFSETPNLTKTTTEDGYNTFQARVKWDEHLTEQDLIQEWGSSFIHFRSDQTAIANMITASTLLVELNWYGEGRTYFRFSLRGSQAAISKARASCRG
jgi:hypothetical protein